MRRSKVLGEEQNGEGVLGEERSVFFAEMEGNGVGWRKGKGSEVR